MRWIIGLVMLVALGSNAVAQQAVDQAKLDAAAQKIQTWVLAPEVLSAIKAQNVKNAGLEQAAIDKMDKQWRAETKAAESPMIDAVLSNALSGYLSKVKQDAGGFYTEIFVMDNKGLNVGQSDMTSDYWQGDEAKFQQTYGTNGAAQHASDVEFDESSQSYQLQLSLTIMEGGTPIGAITVGLDAEGL